MRKIICIIILLSTLCGNIFSQVGKKLSESEKQAFEQKMIDQSKKIETLQCNFMQEKTSALVAEKAVAHGVLLYQSPLMLHWEYTAPTPSTLILNGNNAALFTKDGKKAGNDKMIKQLGGLIISIINGDGIKNRKQFSTEVHGEDNQMCMVLIPVQKRLKEYYKSIELKIDKNTFLASEIIMNEKSGDKMIISLNDKKLNEKIDDKKFEINDFKR
ncbi:MAG: outer membrane lipoprotein carrier protein LolA [Prevotellaceae bacterium]|jgi:outer membrane lipoprotein-sorting protein|nr:outer membrane lipoprotein carrier protein LolA [Prevotellaceae bacterium]